MTLIIKFLIILNILLLKNLTSRKLTAEIFAARLKQPNSVNKTYFGNKLTRFNKKIISNKTKHLEVQKKLNSLITKDYNFFLSRIFITSYDGSRNMFVYEPTFKVLELKKRQGELIHYLLEIKWSI